MLDYRDSPLQAVRVALWVVQQEKRNLRLSLVGFLKHSTGGIDRVESWLESFWGELSARVQKIEIDAILLQFHSKREMEEVLR